MNNKLIAINQEIRTGKKVPDLKSGDIVKVYRKIKEGGKERIQAFEGIIIAIKGNQSSSPIITVRKVSQGVGVELILPIHSPQIDRIEVIKHAKVRRSKLYFMRDKSVKALKMKYEDIKQVIEEAPEKTEETATPAEEAPKEETPVQE